MQFIKQYANGCVCLRLGNRQRERGHGRRGKGKIGVIGQATILHCGPNEVYTRLHTHTHTHAYTRTHTEFQMSTAMAVWSVICKYFAFKYNQ